MTRRSLWAPANGESRGRKHDQPGADAGPQLMTHSRSRLETNLAPHVMRAGARPARLCTSRTAANRHTIAVTSGNALPRFTGSQVVAGSYPVSPTTEVGFELLFSLAEAAITSSLSGTT